MPGLYASPWRIGVEGHLFEGDRPEGATGSGWGVSKAPQIPAIQCHHRSPPGGYRCWILAVRSGCGVLLLIGLPRSASILLSPTTPAAPDSTP
jgi:hypothetical protein